MVEDNLQRVLRVSRQRGIQFTLVVGGLFIAGFVLGAFSVGREPERLVPLGVGLLILVLAFSALQAYFNGSTMLSLLIAVAVPLGFAARPVLLHRQPINLFTLRLGISVGLWAGGVGHLLGAQLTKIHDAPSKPSYRGQLVLGALMVGFAVWHVISAWGPR